MSRLRIFADNDASTPLNSSTDHTTIIESLAQAGVRFERWDASVEVQPGAPQEQIIAAYRAHIDQLRADRGYQTVDVVSMNPDHPDREALRQKFLAEHTHSEDEVRFFVAGSGLFTLHIGDKVYEALCEAGDLISVPGGTPHWFDMGPAPRFVAIRLFTDPAGWVASYTGDDIAARFPRYEAEQAA